MPYRFPHFYFVVCLLIAMYGLAGCSSTKYLAKDEALLFSQSIKGNQSIPLEQLETFYRQKPNRRLLKLPVNPYIPIYFWGKQMYDKKKDKDITKLNDLDTYYDSLLQNEELTSEERRKIIAQKEKKTAKLRLRIKEGNSLMRSVGEKPVLFDSTLMHKTASQLALFLRQKGFFRATVVPTYQITNQRANVVYQITENVPHQFKRILYQCEDTTLLKIVYKDTINCLVKTGKRYDESLMEGERNRITRMLKDFGYYDFVKQYIFFEVDTVNQTANGMGADLRIEIESPKKSAIHKQYTIKEVVMITDVNEASNQIARSDIWYDSLLFRAYRHNYKHKILRRKIHLAPNQFYNQSLTEKTQRSLALLEMYKFVNVKYDTVNGGLRANLYASPAQKYSFTVEGGAELNLSQTVPGPFGSFMFRNLNTFGGCEILTFRLQGSIEAQGALSNVQTNYQSQVLSSNIALQFPTVIAPLPKNWRNNIELLNPTTKLQLGVLFINRPEYIRSAYQATFSYQWTEHQKHFYTINLFDLSIIQTPFLSNSFQELLLRQYLNGNNLLFRFSNAFVPSISLNYVYNTYNPSIKESAKFFRLFVESGGTTLNLLPTEFFRNTPYILDSLRYYRFWKVQGDFRYYYPMGKDGMLVLRANVGAAMPYGTTPRDVPNILPYEKNFFSGGSNSLRAWAMRRLGTGGFLTPRLHFKNNDTEIDVEKTVADGLPNYAIEQAGEALLELNIEYRKKIWGFLHGALFIDAGNVWMLTDVAEKSAKLNFNSFYKQIAVGTGAGLRLDFSFIVMRFDLGVKVYEPGEYDPQYLRSLGLPENFRKKPLWDRDFLGDISNFSFGIGYPF